MKRKVVILFFVIIVFLLAIVSTIAFRNYNAKANNIITFGNIKMQLLQTTLDKNNQEININNDESFDITYNSKINRIIKVGS